uniref:Ricin B lectin domain-containing protein n=1 Tax=Zooxanthella nutricula TaxID=1333877 RepID=A0A7S2JJ02_9DINO
MGVTAALLAFVALAGAAPTWRLKVLPPMVDRVVRRWPRQVLGRLHHDPRIASDDPPDLRVLDLEEVNAWTHSFTCTAEGGENPKHGWSVWKKRWCCSEEPSAEGCHTDVIGTFHICNVRYSRLLTHYLVHKDLDEQVQDGLAAAATNDLHPRIPPGYDWARLPAGVTNVINMSLEEWGDRVGDAVVRFSIAAHEDQLPSVRRNLNPQVIKEKLDAHLHKVTDLVQVTAIGQKAHVCRVVLERQVQKLKCTCSGGTAVKGESCPAEGGEHCQSCSRGYDHVGQKCELYVCHCENGENATGADCNSNGGQGCGACKPGYHKDKTECLENECICHKGSGSRGRACWQDGAESCHNCTLGYHLDTDAFICKPNECNCHNGKKVAPGDQRCVKNGGQACDSCDGSAHTSNDTEHLCVPNECTCTNGTAAVGLLCAEEREHCVACAAGLMLRPDGTCRQDMKNCTCLHGTPVPDEKCPQNGANVCDPEKNCTKGYSLSADQTQCVLDSVCRCENGYGDSSPEKPCTQSEYRCESCYKGYTFSREHKNCSHKDNQCTCEEGGTAALGKECQEEGALVCQSCFVGYHFVASVEPTTQRLKVLCEPNVCKCAHGENATKNSTTECRIDGAEMCVSCHDGYHRDVDLACVESQCTCQNGVGKRGKECWNNDTRHAEMGCESCHDGYHLADASGGVKECRLDSSTTKPMYVCTSEASGYKNRFIGWSRVKKHWCCQNERVGCGFKMTQQQACKDTVLGGLSKRSCLQVGCCQFHDTAHCIPEGDPFETCGGKQIALQSTWGDDEDAKDRMCLSAYEPHRPWGRVFLMRCNPHEPKFDWKRIKVGSDTVQLRNENTPGLCLEHGEEDDDRPDWVRAKVYMMTCQESGSVQSNQTWKFLEDDGNKTFGRYQAVASQDQCLKKGAESRAWNGVIIRKLQDYAEAFELTLGNCSEADANATFVNDLMFSVPQ